MPERVGSSSENPERLLVVRAKAGDREAFSALVCENLTRVYRAAYAVLRNHDDAEDITQETFLRAHRNLGRFDETRPIFPWLYRITRNLCLNRIERVAKRETRLPEFDYVADKAAGPEESAVAAGERERVRDAVSRLPEPHRRIIELSHFQECSYREIADLLEIPIGTVMSRLYNARQRLKSLLEET